MKVYFSGISGTGIGPLAELAYDAGYEVCGSDLMRGAIAPEIDERDIFDSRADGKNEKIYENYYHIKIPS